MNGKHGKDGKDSGQHRGDRKSTGPLFPGKQSAGRPGGPRHGKGKGKGKGGKGGSGDSGYSDSKGY